LKSATAVSAARRSLGTVETIADELVPIPGSVRQLNLRTRDPHAAFGAARLRLRTGRYPTSGSDIALTPMVSRFLAAPVGAFVRFHRTTWHVVGLVDDPAQLDDVFGLVTTLLQAGMSVTRCSRRHPPSGSPRQVRG
jgi:hypothetical protein